MADSDQTATKSVYTPTPVDLAIPRFENDYVSARQDVASLTVHGELNTWVQTGTGAGSTAQTLILESGGNKSVFLQNSLAPASGSLNEIRVTRAGVYKAVYSAQVQYTTEVGDEEVELGIGYSTTTGTAIVNNTPLERVVRVQAPSGQTAGSVNEHITGSVILRLGNDALLRLYDRVLNTVADVTIQNADITVVRLARDGQ